MMKRLALLVVTITGFCSLCSAQNYLRVDYSFGPGRILGVDIKDMEANNCFAAGVMWEHLTANEMGRFHTGFRYRHLQATCYTTVAYGVERYTYDYFEVPFYTELDLFQWFDRKFRFGPDFGVFGAIPVHVEGERVGQNALAWESKYERPKVILGFQVGLHGSVLIKDKWVATASYFGQMPFIPIVGAAPPDTYTGPEYKVHMLGMRGWMFAVSYALD